MRGWSRGEDSGDYSAIVLEHFTMRFVSRAKGQITNRRTIRIDGIASAAHSRLAVRFTDGLCHVVIQGADDDFGETVVDSECRGSWFKRVTG